MSEDPSVSQARLLLAALDEQVSAISGDLEALESHNSRAKLQGRPTDPRAGHLRRELYEVHRMIDGIHRRFPETRRVPLHRQR